MPMLKSNEESEIVVPTAADHAFGRSCEILSASRRFCASRWASISEEVSDDFAELEFTQRKASPLQKLCEVGSEYGLRNLKRTVSSEFLSLLRPRAKQRIKDHL